MKLFKKLLPIASAASIAAIAIPLASCGNKQQSITVNMDDFFTTGYTRETEPLPASTELSSTDGLKKYLEYVKANPIIFADDLYDALYLGINLLFEPDDLTTTLGTTIPLLLEMTGDVTVGEISVNTNESRMSFTINADIVLPVEDIDDDTGETTRFVLKINASLRIEDLAIGMKYDPQPVIFESKTYHMWNLYPDYFTKPYSQDDKWKVLINGWIETTYIGADIHVDIDYNLTNKADAGVLGYLATTLNSIDIPAMYFKNIVASDYK